MALSDLIPRGALFSNESDTAPEYADYTDKYKIGINSYREAIRSEAIRGYQASPEYNNIPKYIEYLGGKQWSQRRPLYRNSFVNNKLSKARVENLSLLTDTRPGIDVYSNSDQFQEQAKITDSVLRAEWFRERMDLSLIKVADLGMLFGTAFAKIDACSPGRMSMLPCGPDQVFPIQPGWDVQSSSAVLYRTWKSVNFFKNKYPLTSAGIERQIATPMLDTNSGYSRPGYVEQYTWNSLSPQMKNVIGIPMAAPSNEYRTLFGNIELQEIYVDDFSINDSKMRVMVKDAYLPMNRHNWWYWVEPGARLYPRKRLLVFGGSKLLYDGPSPYWHGMYPFACLRLDPITWQSFYGYSAYRDLVPIQEQINEIASGFADMQKRILNPVAITRDGAISDSAWREFLTNRPGQKLKLTATTDINTAIKYADNPEIPSWVFQYLTEYLDPAFEKAAGMVNTSDMIQKNQMPGGDTIQQMRDSLQTPNRLKERYLETFLQDCGRLAVSNVFQFYTAKQRLKLLGGNGISMSDFDYNPTNMIPATQERETFWKNFSMNVMPGSFHGGAHDRKKQQAFAAFQAGALDIKTFLNIQEIGDTDEIINNLMQQKQIEAQMAAPQMPPGQGGPSGPPGGGETPRLSREERNGEIPTP